MCDDEKIRIDELPEVCQVIAELAGIDVAIEIARTFSGEVVYFPKFEAVERPMRNRKIRKECNGYNIKELARKYGMTTQAIYQICAKKISEERAKPPEGQMSLWDFE